jgi:hypothetical protein
MTNSLNCCLYGQVSNDIKKLNRRKWKCESSKLSENFIKDIMELVPFWGRTNLCLSMFNLQTNICIQSVTE